MRDKKTNRSRGFGNLFRDCLHLLLFLGFISYDNAMSAQGAITRMNGFQAGSGKRLKVEIKKGEDDEVGPTSGMSSGNKFNPY